MLDTLRSALCALTITGMTGAAMAQSADAYPSKPIKLIVPFGSATTTDAISRVYARKLSEQLRVPVIVENREGAGGLIGATAAAAAAADGYTLLLAVNPPFAVSPLLQKEPSYHPVRDFTAIARVATVPLVMVGSKQAPFRTFAEMVAYARSNPGKLDYASAGIGVPSHLFMEQIKHALNLDIAFVPYKSTGQMSTDLLAGQVPLSLITLGVAKPHLLTGALSGLALGSARRTALFPDMPTLQEATGRPDLGANVAIWYGFLAPRNLQPGVAASLYSAIAAVTATADVTVALENLSADRSLAGPAEFAAEISRNYETSRKLVIDLKLDQQK